MPAPRPDQSQYLAHFTKGANAFDNIVSILDDKIIRAGTLPWTNFWLNLVKSRAHRKIVLGAFCFGSGVLTRGPALDCCRPKPADSLVEFDAPSLRSVGQSYPFFVRRQNRHASNFLSPAKLSNSLNVTDTKSRDNEQYA